MQQHHSGYSLQCLLSLCRRYGVVALVHVFTIQSTTMHTLTGPWLKGMTARVFFIGGQRG